MREFVEDISDVPKAVVEDAGRLLSFETLRERELREFVQQMTGEKQDPRLADAS